MLTLGVFFVFIFPASFYANSSEVKDDETFTETTDRLTNGLNDYIRTKQNEMLTKGTELVEEHQEKTKQFIDDYNAYAANIVEKTSKPIKLSGDSDCLANLRLIDLDLIPVDPMDLLRPLKIQIKDLIMSSPCEMITNRLNEEIDQIDFSADSPFGSISISPNEEDKKADEERKRREKLERKARIRNVVFDMGEDFKLKVTERREVVYDEDGSVINVDENPKIKTIRSKPKTEEIINEEGLFDINDVFGAFMGAKDDDSLDPAPPNDNATADSKSDRDAERDAADEAARARAKQEGDF